MEIWLIRHGETDWNVEGRVQGWTDVPLNDTGKEQAARLAASLRGVPVDHMYSSDLTRAFDTAKCIAAVTGADITTTPDLREQYFGQAEGLLRTESNKRFPNGAPDAESSHDIEQRVASFLTGIGQTHHEGLIVCATHGGVVRAALRWLGLQDGPIDNTSITKLGVEDGTFRVIAVNETPHLDSDAPSTAEGIS
ncbi:histidine phosphatase family protein [Alicyclobacillus acidiphilus]|uniref:histidine phosphatase family protein n=1 Tax=Alicyclobacillus acidiphilus TaxID=182455 RepID=UPI00082EDAAE|nr:histidine phosphatase family protein [Alicyclobacillus acidiphilus]